MSRQQLKEKGFTIIEVVLVLAIAALIFLMVFIALPALQRNQRDTARKTVLSKVSSAVTNYQSNNRSEQPADGQDLAGYIDGKTSGVTGTGLNNAYAAVADVDTVIDNDYIVTVQAYADGVGIGNADTNVVQVIKGAKCGDHAAAAGSTRNAAVFIIMENGLNKTDLKQSVVCQEV